MAEPDPESLPGRRRFLRAATLAGMGAIAGAMPLARASDPDALQKGALQGTSTVSDGTRPRSVAQLPSAAEPPLSPPVTVTQARWGSDFMVDVMRALGIDYVAAIPGNTFKGLHESVVNHGMTSSPPLELISCMHEEMSVAIAHGYAKVSGKPMACMMHSTVGLQHAAMAFYNAYADRVPLFAVVGAILDAQDRHNYVDWLHSVFDGAALVRDFTKWDDTPLSLPHFAESAARAYKLAITPPCGPTLLALDQALQEGEVAQQLLIPKLPRTAPPAGDEGAVRETARLLVAAQRPVIIADRAARTPEGLRLMIELAEALQVAVVDLSGRMNLPWRHPLNQTRRQSELVREADLILGLELTDYWGAMGGQLTPGAVRISVSSADLDMKANYQVGERFVPVDLAIAADAEAMLPLLIEEVRRQTDAARRSAFETRGAILAKAHQESLEQSREAAAVGWDSQPITTARLCAELYGQIRYVVHNNRAYHQEIMAVESVALKRQRGIERARIGNTITEPDIDFARLAAGLGIHGEGPITDPHDLGPALQRAVAVVKRGEPALVDVISQGR